MIPCARWGVAVGMEEMPSLNMPVQSLKVAILPLDLPCSGPVTHSREILTTGKSHEICKLIKRHGILIGLVPSEANQADPLRKGVKVKVKVNFAVYSATKTNRGSRCIAVIFCNLSARWS